MKAIDLCEIQLAQRGDVDARNRLVERHIPLLRLLIGRCLPDCPVNEYLAVATMAFMRAVDAWKPGRACLNTLAGKCIWRSLKYEHRRWANHSVTCRQLGWVAAPKTEDHREGLEWLRRAISELDDRTRLIVHWRLEHRSLRWIAARLGLSTQRVAILYHAAVDRLKAKVEIASCPR